MKKGLTTLLILLSLTFTGKAYAINLVSNSGFDTGLLTPWTENSPGNTDASVTIAQFLSPDYSAKFRAWNNVNDQTVTLKQGFTILPSTTYYASSYLRSLQGTSLRDGAYAWVSLDWYTVKNGTKLGSINSNQLNSYNSDWELFQTSGLSPSTANYAVMYLNMFSPDMPSSSANRIAYFDNARVDTTAATPEPATMSLLGLGLLGLLGFKRKK